MIYISVFQPISDQTPNSGIGKIAFQLYQHLAKNKKVQIFFGHKGNILEPNVRDLGKLYHFIFRVLGFLSRFVPYYFIRNIQEIFFDFFFSFKIKKEVTVLITTNAWIPISIRKAKKYNIKTHFISGNANENMIYNLVKSEKNRLGILTKDAFDYYPRLHRYNKTIINVQYIICINKYILNSFKNSFLNINKVLLLPTIFDANYNDFEITKIHNEIFTIFYCAHTTTLKGLHILLDAYFIFMEGKADIQLVIGGKIDTSILDKISKSLNNTTIKIIGNLNSSQVAGQLKTSNLFVVPSLTDAGPVTMIEAMYTRTPVVCSSGVGNQELIKDGFNGFIYKINNAIQLSEKLEQAYTSKDKLTLIGGNARKTVIKCLSLKREFLLKFESLINNENTSNW